MEGCDTEATGGAANSSWSLKKPGLLQQRRPKNERHEVEVSERKFSPQARSLTEEQIARNKESRATGSRRRTRGNTSRKWNFGLQKICDGILALMDKNLIPSARRIAGAEGHQQRTVKRSSSLSESIMNRAPRSDRQHRKPRTTRILRSRVVYPGTHSTT